MACAAFRRIFLARGFVDGWRNWGLDAFVMSRLLSHRLCIISYTIWLMMHDRRYLLEIGEWRSRNASSSVES